MSTPILRPRIMVVDDAPVIRRCTQNFLEPTYEVILVSDGFSALADIQEQRPDLLLLDVSMPRLDGLTTCQAVKQNPDFSEMPIIFMTSKDSAFDKARGTQMGCDDYITKPFLKEELLMKIQAFLKTS